MSPTRGEAMHASSHRWSSRRRWALPALGVALALGLTAGCGDGDSSQIGVVCGTERAVEPAECFLVGLPGGDATAFELADLEWESWGEATTTGLGADITIPVGQEERTAGPAAVNVELSSPATGCEDERYYERGRLVYPGGEFDPIDLELRTCPPADE